MSSSKEIVFLILQSLDEEKFKATVHQWRLEQESGLFFNIGYFEELVINGAWDEVEKYLSGFTNAQDNTCSMRIFFEIRKQKYLEALDRNGTAKAVDILKKDLKVFSALDQNVLKEMAQLLTLENFRERKQLSLYGDTKSARRYLFHELELLIHSNPLLHDKLNFPNLNSGLGTLMNQSLNWQHPFHENRSSVANPLMDVVPKAGVFSPLGAHGPALGPPPTYTAGPPPTSLKGRMDGPSFIPHASSSAKRIGFTAFSSSAKPIGFAAFNSGADAFYPHICLNVAAILERPGIPPTNNSAVVNQSTDSKHVLVRQRPSEIPDEVLHNRSSVFSMDLNGINQRLADEKSRIADELVDKSRMWKPTEISEPSQCRSLRLPDNLIAARVSRLLYTNSGAILALTANATHKLWKWPRNNENSTGKATARIVPQLWQPSSGMLVTNDVSNTNPEDAVPCLALSKNGAYVMSASGGIVSLYPLMTFETITTFMPPPPAATFLAFYPQDNDIIAVGMEDSSIQIYYYLFDKVNWKLEGHRERITGLAFSNVLNVLVSSGADSRVAFSFMLENALCVWSTDGWQKRRSKCLQIPVGQATVPLTDTCIQFHQDQTRLLVVHATQIAIYEAPMLEQLNQWIPPKANAPRITHATYSCDSQSIYVGFDDGSVGILTASASLQLRCLINSTSYLPANPSSRVHPLVIAAHPSEPNQFALGLSDGGVCVLQPIESEGKWGTSPPHENFGGPSSTTSEVDSLNQP
ncbi:protein TOPLESS-like [Cornus florida]|uniref:protein TOPLESS-like n=1 Tax=Cornus florida TaxID=4283 RepID=UPI0028984EB7|nr:protein TOPLESS-like [Cornus florida]